MDGTSVVAREVRFDSLVAKAMARLQLAVPMEMVEICSCRLAGFVKAVEGLCYWKVERQLQPLAVLFDSLVAAVLRLLAGTSSSKRQMLALKALRATAVT
jgi:hypothetical protein